MQINSCQSRRSLPFITLFKATRCVMSEDVHAKVHHCHQRQCVPGIDDKCINEHWTHLRQSSTSSKPGALFNALKFRLHNVHIPQRNSLPDNSIANNSLSKEKQLREEESSISVTVGDDNLKIDDDNENVCCELWLGITDYKSSIGTTTHIASYYDYARKASTNLNADNYNNNNNIKWKEQIPGANEERLMECNTKDIHCYLSNALGVESIAVTSDRKVVLFCRSQDVAEYKGYYCCPGGHPEPTRVLNTYTRECDSHCVSEESEKTSENRVSNDFNSADETREDDGVIHNCIDNHNDSYNSSKNKNNNSNSHIGETIDTVCMTMMNSLTSQAIVDELFQSIVLEVADELGLDLERCHNYGLMGIMEATTTFKPDLCFWVQLDYTSDEVQSCFDARCGTDAFESVAHSLRFIPIDQFSTEESVHEFVKNELQGLLTPSSYASLVHAVNYKNYIPVKEISTHTNIRQKK